MVWGSRSRLLILLVILLTPSFSAAGVIADTGAKGESFLPSQTSNWLTGWQYRKAHTISGSAGTGTDYQIRINMHRTNGSDSGEDVYVDTKCKGDYGDIRFTEVDGVTMLDYWIERHDSDSATFWVEVKNSLDTSQSIFIYYGHIVSESISNGTATFPFFDDFNRPDSDSVGGGWYDDSGDGNNDIENNLLKTVQNENQYCHIEQSAPSLSNFVLHGKLKQHANAPDLWRMAIGAYWSSDKWMKIGWRSTSDTVSAQLSSNPDGGGSAAVLSANLDDTWCYYKIEVNSSSINFHYSLDTITWVLVHSFQRYAGVSGVPVLIIIGKGYENTLSNPEYPNLDWDNNYENAGPEYMNFADDVFVRKFVDNEPTHDSWGAEEISQSTTSLTTPLHGLGGIDTWMILIFMGGGGAMVAIVLVIVFMKRKGGIGGAAQISYDW